MCLLPGQRRQFQCSTDATSHATRVQGIFETLRGFRSYPKGRLGDSQPLSHESPGRGPGFRLHSRRRHRGGPFRVQRLLASTSRPRSAPVAARWFFQGGSAVLCSAGGLAVLVTRPVTPASRDARGGSLAPRWGRMPSSIMPRLFRRRNPHAAPWRPPPGGGFSLHLASGKSWRASRSG